MARSGFELGDTSLVIYFTGADAASWQSWRATVFDPRTGQAQQSRPLAGQDLPKCGEPRQYCRGFGAADGWVLTVNTPYLVTITVTRTDGSEVISAPSNEARARQTIVPPEIPSARAAGCGCPNALAASVPGQSVRGAGVNTATGAFAWIQQDLKMASFAVPFGVTRTYSSANTGAGTLGRGWAWTYDVRTIPPVAGETAVTVRAEDGAQATYTRNADGSYARPAGVRSNLLALPDGTWQLVTPGQVTYAFDNTGRLTAITNPRGHGIHIGYSGAGWEITDASGRKVAVKLNTAGLVEQITLPDGRKVRYSFQDGTLAAVQDAEGQVWSYEYADGVLAEVIDPRGQAQITNEYAGGRVVAQSDANGAKTTFAWDTARQEAKTTDADGVVFFDGYRGNVLVYAQNGNGDAVNTRYTAALDQNLTVDARGNQREREFDAAGNRTSSTAPEPFSFTERNSYDGRNNPTSFTNGEGHTTAYGYSPYDEPERETAAGGEKTRYQRDARGLVTAITDPRNKVTTFGYDAAGNMLARTTPTGARTTYTYDKTGRRLSQTNPRGNLSGADPRRFTTRYGYDALDRVRTVGSPEQRLPRENRYDELGQLVKTIDPLGRITCYQYDRVIGRQVAVTDPRGSVTRTGYSSAGRQVSHTDAMGNKATYTYDHRGKLASTVSPRGNARGANPDDFTTRYFYDNNGNLVRTARVFPGGGSADVDTGFDALDRQNSSTDELGNRTTTKQDNTDNLISTVDPLGQETKIAYDANGRPSAVTAAQGGESKVNYDPAGNPVRKVSMAGGITTLAYNDDNRVVSVTDPRGNVSGADPGAFATRYSYDAAGNLVAVADPLGNTTRFGYDANNRVLSNTDANSHATRFSYDDADQLVAVFGPDSKDPTKYVHDGDGTVTSRVDPLGRETRYGYDRLGQLRSVTDPLNRTRGFGYDEERNLTRIVNAGRGDPKSRTITDTYDPLNRRVRRQLGVDGPVYGYGYDAKNRLTSLADPAGVRIQDYDERDRLVRISRGGQTFGYGYDRDGNVTRRDWPDGTQVTAQFDGAGQLTGMTASGGAAGPTPSAYGFTYDPSGRLSKTTHPAGLVTDRAYDTAGRMVDVNTHAGDAVVAGYQVARDPVGNPTRIITTRGDRTEVAGYSYDAADRVIAACYGGAGLRGGEAGCNPAATGTVRYGYDAVGNRLSQARTGTMGSDTTRYDYDSADQLVREITKADDRAAGVVRSFDYDDEGNQTRAGGDTFRYNLDHTLASATTGGRSTEFGYDAAGLRISAVTGADTRTWSWDTNGQQPWLALESGPAGQRGFLPAPGHGPLATLAGGVRSYVPDWLGGVASVTSPSGAVEESYDFDPYGVPRANGTADPGDGTNPLRFTGSYADPALGGRYALPARTYDPATGRFGGLDPVPTSLRQPGVSTYAYALDRPTAMLDPTGGAPIPDGGGGNLEPEPLTPAADAGEWDKAPWELPCQISRSEYCQILRYMHSEMVTNAKSEAVSNIKALLEFERYRPSGFWARLFGPNPRDQANAGLSARAAWFAKVCQDLCPWDHKPKIREKWNMKLGGSPYDPDSPYSAVPGRNYLIFYDVWSNIHFGYVGVKAAFSGEELQQGAGSGFPGAGDNDPGDVITVQIGIDLGQRYSPDQLQPDNIDYGIRGRLVELFLLPDDPSRAKQVVVRK